MANNKYDFSGYATKVGLKCTDGRTIMQDAFQDNDGGKVPLVWQHLHHDPTNVLGHAILENRKDGVYAYCSLNETPAGTNARELIAHGDISALSIYANSLIEKGKNVIHGAIREVSLVIAGANPEAYIDNIAFEHGDGSVVDDESEAIICANSEIELFHSEEPPAKQEIKHAAPPPAAEDETVGDVFETMNEKQKNVVYALVAQALEDAETSVAQSALNDEGDNKMKRNIFDKSAEDTTATHKTLTHDDLKVIMDDAKRLGSLKEAFLQHEGTYGIDNIDYLFPDARNITNTPVFIKRETGWVKDVFNAAHHTPFSRIKSVLADITGEEARARGYTKGNQKLEEVFTLLKRTTSPTTIYKKQKLDRDDIVDIIDLDVVAWLKLEMRMMLDEEIARAMLVGDGRSTASDDKIKEDCIRPIYTDDDLYSVKVSIPVDATTSETIDAMILARKDYKGSGNPTFFSTPDIIGNMLLLKDNMGRRLYNTITDLAAAIRVRNIVEVPVLENLSRVNTTDSKTYNLLGIIINMSDYYLGADKGGAVNMFDDFDIDYNQYKYLIETRCSGALTLPGSALIIEQATT